MSRLFSSGFELRSVTSGVEWQTVTGSPTISTTQVNPNGGSASLRCNPTEAAWYVSNTFQADTINTHYERFYFYIATLPSATTYIWQYLDGANGVGDGIQLTPAGVLQFVNVSGTGTPAGATVTPSVGAWHRLELKFVDDAGSAAIFEWYLDGVLVATMTGQTGINAGGRSRLGVITATTADIYFDDYAVNNTAGTVQNGYPGDGRIVHARPSSAGDNAGWTPLAGTNWDAVDEQTPDNATSYVSHSATGTVIDDHRVTVPTISAASITLVQVGIRGGSTATTTGVTIQPRLKSAAAGTTTIGTGAAFNVNGWRSFSASPFIYQLTSYTDPTTGVAWTATGTNSLANMQIGYQDGASNTTVKRVTTVWALIEFVPNTTTTTTTTAAPANNAKFLPFFF